MKSIHNLVLGTAQLGLPYGIANQIGQPDQNIATAIIHEAWEHGVIEFDTAQAYGDSEQVLGKALYELGISNEAKIITKFDPDLDHLNAKTMSRALDRSLQQLGVSSLFGIMLHREEMLSLWDKGLAEILYSLVSSGKVKKIGTSVYTPDGAIEALSIDGIDMVQLPANILDRRFENAGVFELADKRGKTIYIRSIFLQGLLLMDPKETPDKMAFARPIIEKFESLSRELGLKRQEIALGYLKQKIPQAYIIFGAESPEQVRRNVVCWRKSIQQNLVTSVEHKFNDIDEVIIRPDLWPK